MRHSDVTGPDVRPELSLDKMFVAGHRPAATVLGGLAVLLYAVSFFLPALDRLPGYGAFVLSLVFFYCLPMWAANPVLWFGLFLLAMGECRAAGKAGLLALLLALSECWMFSGELSVGYFVWVGSMAVLAAAGLCGGRREDRPPRWPALPGWWRAGEAARLAAGFRR